MESLDFVCTTHDISILSLNDWKCSVGGGRTRVHEPQEAWRQNEMIGGKPPFIK
jgi:hypothetical protein